MFQLPRTPFDKLPASGGERGICTSNSPSTIKASVIQPLGLFAFGLNSNLLINTPQDVSHYDSKQTGIVKLTWFQGEGAVK